MKAEIDNNIDQREIVGEKKFYMLLRPRLIKELFISKFRASKLDSLIC